MNTSADVYSRLERLRSRFCPNPEKNYLKAWADAVARDLSCRKATVADLAVGT